MEQDRRDELKNENKGYNYYMDVRYKEYISDEMEEIVKHKNAFLEKFQLTDGISRAELQQASDNYRSLTDEEAVDVLARVARTSMCNTMGAAYTDSFFAPTGYESTIVDAEDVFAVGFTSDYRLKGNNEEVILCAVFTNDPYIPYSRWFILERGVCLNLCRRNPQKCWKTLAIFRKRKRARL